MVTFKLKGSFKNTKKFFNSALNRSYISILQQYGQEGVSALSSATPVDTGKTAQSWEYKIEQTNGSIRIYWNNTNVQKGVQIAVIIQTGHGTGTGGYVQGRDYINPAIRPVFDKIAENVWRELTK